MKTSHALEGSPCHDRRLCAQPSPRMKRWPVGARILACLAATTSVYGFSGVPATQAAASVEGTIMGQVRDIDSSQPVPGVTVIASGPEGDVAALTDAKGAYRFEALPIGHYTMRFHRDQVLAERETTVGVDKIVRLNIRLPAVPSETETVAAPYVAPAIDVGSSRIGSTFRSDFIENIPNRGDDVSSLIEKTPGGYNDVITLPATQSAVGLSLSGGTGVENAYYLEGLNVTGLRDGLLGTNLKSFFLEEVEVVSAGYGAEYGPALGGVVNMALKSGSNEWKGSALTWVDPGWAAANPHRVSSLSTVLTGNTQPDYTTQLGAEVGGPIVKNKLFIWVGYAPQISSSHFAQYTDRFSENPDIATNPNAPPIVQPLFSRMIPQQSTTQNYAGKLTWRLSADHMLSLSLVGTRNDQTYMRGANMDLLAGMSHEITSRQDVIAHWQSAFFERHFRVDATLGLHSEGYSRRSPYGDAESMNDITWDNNPSLAQFDPALQGYCQPTADGFQPCPVQGYQSGGYGVLRDVSAYRLAGQVKLTNIFTALGLHQLSYGLDYEINQYHDKRWVSGVDGARGSVLVDSSGVFGVSTLNQLPYGTPFPIGAPDYSYLAQAPYYRDAIDTTTHAYNSGLFAQESYMPLSNLTINLGLRWETQRLTDYNGNTALSITDSLAPRLGVVYDPTKEGRSKIFAHYGRYYESIPMDLADRVFGYEGSAVSIYTPDCSPQNWRACQPFLGQAINPGGKPNIQPNIKGEYNNEVVLGGQYQLLRDWVVGASLIYRWLGEAIDDVGQVTLDNPVGATLLANPTDPKPERTYKALQLTAAKSLSKKWFFSGSYTYSRTMGNYTGLYNAGSNQLDPNLTTQWDAPQLMANHYGPLPNDRPHVIHLDGYYRIVWGDRVFSPGLSFSGYSGTPLTPLGKAPLLGPNEAYIWPRGSEGRTPFVTQLDAHLSYRTRVTKELSAEAFIDIFNILNRQTALTQDATYTVDRVMPVDTSIPLNQVPRVDNGGNKLCQSAAGTTGTCGGTYTTPLYASRNGNYLQPTSYQAPISGRIGVRVMF